MKLKITIAATILTAAISSMPAHAAGGKQKPPASEGDSMSVITWLYEAVSGTTTQD